ncbi:TIGR03618 family F420-dependent PPOX class oxidoreductase [Georgenia thermotolerans]|uniref:TIGR03618 family F420-dependent PPOX class oxidoreductase n=1 Tax=Georgenia thermotolerans TaxID=527326 RepID=A0A7J5UU20_9MICO|nr:TIGR03618 family F420-dependent PPOX class oxidoreductase [Georgenia thermotolerans]KAE8765782.1 TIGR03618 family F420-dependent PPOX class oxidoreductase [Georgenia thermotolerans]
MARLNDAARALIASGPLGHLVTLDPDGSPQVTAVWVGLDGDDLVTAHLPTGLRKLANIRRDPRVVLSFESTVTNAIGLREYLVVHGRAHITEGGAPELLHRLAQTYIGPGAQFPPMPDPPPGVVVHVEVTRVGGVGPW